MRRLLLSTATVVVGLLVFSAAPASAAPQGHWMLPAGNLSVAGQAGLYPEIASGSDGTVTAVWWHADRSGSNIQSATRPPGGSFGSTVNTPAVGQGGSPPQVAIGPDGATTLIWSGSGSSGDVVQVATRRHRKGKFGHPVNVSSVGQNVLDPQIAIAPDGTAIAVWSRNGVIQAATRRHPRGKFSSPVNLSAPGQHALAPRIAIAPGGTTTVVWSRNSVIQAATRPLHGSFGSPANVSGPDHDAGYPQIATARDGTVTVVWVKSEGAKLSVWAATRPSHGGFGATEKLSRPGQDSFGPQIAMASDGSATAVWAASKGSNTVIQAASRPPKDLFGAPVNLSKPGGSARDPEIGIARDGTATVIWHRTAGSIGPRPRLVIQASTRRPGRGFGSPVNLSAADHISLLPQLTIAPDGRATAVWQRSAGANFIIQQASTKPMRPKISKVRIRPKKKKLRAGKKIRLKVKVTNSGKAVAKNVKVHLRSSNKRVKVRKKARIKRIAPGKTRKVKVRVKARRRARGKARITAKVAGKKGHAKLKIRCRG